MSELETRERLVRVETKLDLTLDGIRELTATVKTVQSNQDLCPARQAYLSRRLVTAEDDLRRQRLIGRTGWLIAILGGAINFGPKAVEIIKKLF